MDNATIAQVLGVGIVILQFTSRNPITLKDVHYVLDIRKNSVSGDLFIFGRWFI